MLLSLCNIHSRPRCSSNSTSKQRGTGGASKANTTADKVVRVVVNVAMVAVIVVTSGVLLLLRKYRPRIGKVRCYHSRGAKQASLRLLSLSEGKARSAPLHLINSSTTWSNVMPTEMRVSLVNLMWRKATHWPLARSCGVNPITKLNKKGRMRQRTQRMDPAQRANTKRSSRPCDREGQRNQSQINVTV